VPRIEGGLDYHWTDGFRGVNSTAALDLMGEGGLELGFPSAIGKGGGAGV